MLLLFLDFLSSTGCRNRRLFIDSQNKNSQSKTKKKKATNQNKTGNTLLIKDLQITNNTITILYIDKL